MNIQNSKEPSSFFTGLTTENGKENRHFSRHKIKRRILIKDPHGNIQTGHAFDISRQGLQFRCTQQIAFLLETSSRSRSSGYGTDYEVKIALPFMNKLTECGIYCAIKDVTKADEENMRIGLSFLYFDKDSQSKLDHFIDNLTL